MAIALCGVRSDRRGLRFRAKGFTAWRRGPADDPATAVARRWNAHSGDSTAGTSAIREQTHFRPSRCLLQSTQETAQTNSYPGLRTNCGAFARLAAAQSCLASSAPRIGRSSAWCCCKTFRLAWRCALIGDAIMVRMPSASRNLPCRRSRICRSNRWSSVTGILVYL